MNKAPLILAIESSCDDTSVAILRGRKVLANIVASQSVHEKYGGVVPELASRAHQQHILPTVDVALKNAGVALKELDARGFEGDLTGLLQRDTDVSAVLQKAIKQQDELDAYMSTNFIKELDKADPSGAYKWATSNPAHAKEMMKHIKGDKTKEGQVRKVFLDKMFSKVTSRTQETVGQVLDGDVLQNGVKEYNLLAKGCDCS